MSWGGATDVLGDASRVALRERIIHAVRRFRPYGIVGFDPDSVFYEDNLDHRVLAQAVDEAYWCAQFDKHHPEHMEQGLEEHGAFERWFFGRTVLSVTHVFDTESVFDRQIEALLCHRTMLDNIARQFRLQARTGGVRVPAIEAATGPAIIMHCSSGCCARPRRPRAPRSDCARPKRCAAIAPR